MSDTNVNVKVKTYRNPDRDNQASYKPYVPQYQVHGKEPEEYQGAIVPGGIALAKPGHTSLDNPRAKRPVMRQPYAAETASPVGRGPVPNVGNNMEHTWSSVDGEVVDDLSGEAIDPNHSMVDNNDFVSDEALGIPLQTNTIDYRGWQNGLTADDIRPPAERGVVTIQEVPQPNNQPDSQSNSGSGPGSDEIFYILNDLEENSYILIVDGTPVCSGPMEEIQDQARAMVFGEHEVCDGNPTSPDDIVILKRVKVKVGLFLE